MRDDLERNLASKIDPRVVADILNAYEGLIQKHRALDAEAALTRAGKFVEHVFRALEFIRTGTAPAEIKSPAQTAKQLENDTSLPEPIPNLNPTDCTRDGLRPSEQTRRRACEGDRPARHRR